jgi:hypothetical protein
MFKSQQDLFFAFPDGVLHYVCAECTAICCKGFGFGGSLERHVRSLFVLYPALESTMVSRSGDIVELSTPATGCHFLEPDNHCGIERHHGKDAKPGICTLFPFNLLRRIGRTIVVGPHFLCPLRVVVPARPGEVEGTHAAIAGAVEYSGLLGLDGRGSHIPSVPARVGVSPGTIVDQEVAFRDSCAESIGRTSFRSGLRRFASDPHSFDADVQRISAIAGIDSAPPLVHDRLDEVLYAIAPTLRLEYLRLSSDGVLRALALTEALLRNELALSDRVLDPHVAFRNASVRKAAIQLLAHGDELLILKRTLSAKAPPISDPQLTFAAFLAGRGLANGMGVASAFESALPADITTADRMTLVMSLGARVDPLLARRRDGAN